MHFSLNVLFSSLNLTTSHDVHSTCPLLYYVETVRLHERHNIISNFDTSDSKFAFFINSIINLEMSNKLA